MSDPDAAPDPIDKAYAEAEAMLGDEAARAARRARVLGAVAREPVTTSAASRLSIRRYGGWLAAASVVGLSVFAAARLDLLAPRPPKPPAVQTRAVPGVVAAPPPPALVQSQAPSPRAFPAARRAEKPASAPVPIAPAPRVMAPAAKASAPADAAAPETRAFAPAPAPPAPAVVEAGRRDAPAFAGPANRLESSARPPSDQAARLRAAAAAGRTAEVDALLAGGAPVDAPDAEGETALMKAIEADQPAAAALLRRHGAGLDRRNHAGQRARDMAAAIGDAALDQALGLGP